METKSQDNDWFSVLCAELGLRPVAPVQAHQLQVGQRLFTAMGDPREIVAVRVWKRTVAVRYSDGWRDSFAPDKKISLIAEVAVLVKGETS